MANDEQVIKFYEKQLANARETGDRGGEGKTLVKLGLAYATMGRHEEAIRCYDQALELDPHNKSAWSMKGGLLDVLGRHEEAIRCYDKALELDPLYKNAWARKALAQHKLGRRQEAVQSRKQYLALRAAKDTQQTEAAHPRIQDPDDG